MALQTLLSFSCHRDSHGRELEMGGKNELLGLAREIEEIRRIRNALLSSAGYHDKEWLSQKRKLLIQGVPDDEMQLIDESWALQHKKGLLLKSKLSTYIKEHTPLMDEALAVEQIVVKEPPIVQRPTSEEGPRRHSDLEAVPAKRESNRESIVRERKEETARRKGYIRRDEADRLAAKKRRDAAAD